MKKIYTSLTALGLAAGLQAQVIMNVEQPGNLAGAYTVTWAEAGTWGVADLTDPANAITDTLAFVDDGTAADSLGCNALVNGPAVAGKIAVVYRGSCEFGAKALNAQDAGAVGVVIINNQGAPIVPGAGAVGAQVTIPVVMISTNDGALLASEIAAGNVVAFIGSISGLYTNDVGYFAPDVIVPSHTAFPALCAQNSSEFGFPLGLWLTNYGTADQSGVTVSVDVSQNGSSVFSTTSAPFDILSGDSTFIDLGDFSLSSYSGFYTLTYSAALDGVTEDFPSNNIKTATFNIGSVVAYTPVDESTGLPIFSGSAVPVDNTAGFTLCNFFQDDNASRLGVSGLHFSISPVTAGTDITGTLVNLDCFKVLDPFTGFADFPTDPTLDPIASEEYTLPGNTPNQTIFAPFGSAFALEDNTGYLFCITTFTSDVRIGYNDLLNYDLYRDSVDQVVSTVQDNTGFFKAGFVGGGAASIAVQTVPVQSIGIEENGRTLEVMPFPNPTTDMLSIPLSGFSGAADMRITDAKGAVVVQQRAMITGERVLVDVTGIAAGTYTFNMAFADGRNSTFRVVVSK